MPSGHEAERGRRCRGGRGDRPARTREYSDGMPGRRTIGVDMGGTKLLAGAADEELSVHHRTQRTLTGLDQAGLIDAAVEAVEETREQAAGEVEAVGFGIPSLIDQRTGIAVVAISLPLADIRFA